MAKLPASALETHPSSTTASEIYDWRQIDGENDGFIRAHFVRRQAKLIRHKAYGQDSPLCVHGYSVEPRSVSPVGACHIAFADRRGALFA